MGNGNWFCKKLSRVEQYGNIRYVCDNNDDLWGKEIVPGIQCISPSQLTFLEDIFVVIMLENATTAFLIASQLLDAGISDFDLVDH